MSYQEQGVRNQKLIYFAKNTNKLPLPLTANPIGSPFVELQSVDSTNKYAMNLVHEGMAQHGMVIFAHDQTAGKGQRGKNWSSEKGANISLSIIINPYPLKVSDTFKLSVCTSVSAFEFLKKYAGDESRIKWPNDIYWRDRKAGGILIENIIRSSESEIGSRDPIAIRSGDWKWSVIGIGININQTFFFPDLPNPVSVKQITGKHFEPVSLAKDLCVFFNKNFQILLVGNFETIFTTYLASLYKKNEKVKLKKDGRIFEVTIKTVAETGQLITQHAIEERFEFGEVEWVQ